MKRNTLIVAQVVVVAAIHVLLFSSIYNSIASPYLHEAKRVENAETILFVIFPVTVVP